MTAAPARERLGFLGTGTITAALVSGLRTSSAPPYPICVSPRNAQTSSALKDRFAGITVGASNQDVLDRSDTIFLAVRPQIAREVFSGLSFRKEQHVISLVATFSQAQIAALVAPASSVVCAVPLPTVALHLGPTAIFPASPIATTLFGYLGTALEAATEDQFRALASTTATMGAYFALLDVLHRWLTSQGVETAMAHTYLTMMVRGLADVSQDESKSFATLSEEFQTKGGLNEQLLVALREGAVFEHYGTALDAVLLRIKRSVESR